MFGRNKTVFILGAGASCHYGYPTGEGLVREVLQKSINARDFFRGTLADAPNGTAMPIVVTERAREKTIEHYRDAATELALACQSLIDRLVAVNPPVIDYFLGQNEDLRDIGRLMIAWSILERESYYEATQSYPTYREFTKFVEDD